MFLYKGQGKNGLFGNDTLDILQEREEDDIESDIENSHVDTKIEDMKLSYRLNRLL